MSIEPLTANLRLATRGDAALWIAPRTDGNGTVTVLHFTTNAGNGCAITLTPDDLVNIRDTANRILTATPGEIEQWVDDAAHAVVQETRRDTANQPRRQTLQPQSQLHT